MTSASNSSNALRVVSLLPSATEIVDFVGARDFLVGATHECDYPGDVQNLPKLTGTFLSPGLSSAEIDAAIGQHLTDTGSIYSLDIALLGELEPDLIITQGLCDVCAVSLDVVEQAAAALPGEARVLSLNPTTIGEVLDTTLEVGDALDRTEEARQKVASLRTRLAAVRAAVEGLLRARVGCIEWLDPPFSAGHWVPEMVSLAGGEDLLAEAGEPSERLSWERVFRAAPEVLILMPCGFDTERALQEARGLPELPGWRDLPAVKNGRVWVVDANSYFSRPAPRLVEGVELLAHILHPGALPGSREWGDAVRLSYAIR